MVNKIVTKIGKKVAKKTGSKAIKKTSDTIEYFDQRIGWGIKPLNVGEKETIECLKKYPNNLSFCQSIGNKVRDNYNHPWRHKK